MKKVNLLFAIITIFSLFIGIDFTLSQIDNNCAFPDIVCGMGSTGTSYGWPYFPMSNDTLKVLVVFCNFPSPSGNFDINDCLLQYWPGDSGQIKPSWADSVICSSTQLVWNPSMTGYFKSSSMNRFYLIGDVYPELYIFEHQVAYYSPDSLKIGYAVRELLLGIDDNVDFSQYDKFDPEDYDNDNNYSEPDNTVDFIFIIFRFTNSHTIDPDPYTGKGYSGIALLGGRNQIFGIVNNGNDTIREITLDGKKILAKFPGAGCISEMTNPWGIGVSTHEFAEHYGYGYGHSEAMGGYNIYGGGIASANDREHFGWNTSSAIIPSNNTTITLRDYITTNDYIKIPRYNNTIYIENRRRLNYYSSTNNILWKWGCSDPLRPLQSDSALIIYRKTGERSFKIQSADGNWSWSLCPGSYYKVDYISPRNNYFYKDTPYRFNEDLSAFYLIDKQVKNTKCEQNNLPSSLSYMGAGGDNNTCFDVDFNDVFSPWSNPALIVNNSSDSLTIEINGRDQNGDLIVNIYFTNITAARPSKPTGLKVERFIVKTDTSYHPYLTWQKNLEPDFQGVYKIFRGNSFDETTEPSYALIATITDTSAIPEYLDEEVLLYFEMQYKENCGSNYLTYSYKVQAVDIDSLESAKSDRGYLSGWTLDCTGSGDKFENTVNPKVIELKQNYPNPFNPITNIQYYLPHSGIVKITIYDILGREVKILENKFKEAGYHTVSFDGSALSSGIYFYRLNSNNLTKTKKMVIIK